MSDAERRRKLEELDAKLAARRAAETQTKAHQEEHYSQAQQAWRMVTELVAGLGIGFGIGYGLDAIFNTQPFLMVLFTLLGIAAGINVMIRTAREIQTKEEARAAGQQETTGPDAAPDRKVQERDRDGD